MPNVAGELPHGSILKGAFGALRGLSLPPLGEHLPAANDDLKVQDAPQQQDQSNEPPADNSSTPRARHRPLGGGSGPLSGRLGYGRSATESPAPSLIGRDSQAPGASGPRHGLSDAVKDIRDGIKNTVAGARDGEDSASQGDDHGADNAHRRSPLRQHLAS